MDDGWTLDSVERGPNATTFELSHDERDLACVIDARRAGPSDHKLTIRFIHTVERPQAQAHACAEAARLIAVAFDTIGDLGRKPEDRVQVNVPQLVIDQLLGARVEIAGPDALITVAPFFGDEACDAMVSSPLFWRASAEATD